MVVVTYPTATPDQDTGAFTLAGREVDRGPKIVDGVRQRLNADQYDLIGATLPEVRQRVHPGALYAVPTTTPTKET